MDDAQKLRNLRARVDELWAISQTVSRTLMDEQSRCSRLQEELGEAIKSLHEAQKKLVASELRLAEVMAAAAPEPIVIENCEAHANPSQSLPKTAFLILSDSCNQSGETGTAVHSIHSTEVLAKQRLVFLEDGHKSSYYIEELDLDPASDSDRPIYDLSDIRARE